MTDQEAPSERRAKGLSLLAELTALDDDVYAAALALEQLVKLSVLPEGASLAAGRLRFSRALRRHLQHIDSAVMPYLRDAADARASQIIGNYRRTLNSYHEAAAHHVAQWPSTSVTQDWDGYRRSVADMLSRLRKRIETEHRDIHPLLADRDSSR